MEENKSNSNFHLMLFSESEKLSELWLPDVVEGYFYFSDNYSRGFLSITAKNKEWVVSCNKPAYFTNVPLGQNFEVNLYDNQILEIDYKDYNYLLYVEKITATDRTFKNYSVSDDAEILIGSGFYNDICYNSSFVSENHAVIKLNKGQFFVTDQNSKNGVYVNGYRCTDKTLQIGDVVSIIGLKIIIGPRVLSINNPKGNVAVKQERLQKLLFSYSATARYYGEFSDDLYESFFNRLPRKRLPLKESSIIVEGPPMSMDSNKMPLVLRMGSSLVMGGTAALAGNFTTLLSSVLLPFVSSKYTDKQRKDYENLRQTKYTEYLEQKKAEFDEACKNERTILNSKYPKGNELLEIVNKRIHLWERRPYDSDFLHLRLGTGRKTLSSEINYPARHFELESDELEEKMYDLVEDVHWVDDIPIILSLVDTRVCGLLGNRTQLIDFIRKLVLQTAIFHSYDEVKMVFLLNKYELECLEEVKYLPHFWDNDQTFRFVATNEVEAYKVGEYIKNQLSNDKDNEKDISKIMKKRSFFVIFALDKKLVESHEVFGEIIESDDKSAVSIIAAYDDLPKETQKIITLKTAEDNICTTLAADGGEDESFSADCYNENNMIKALKNISNIRLKTDEKAKEMPKSVTFLEMFNVGRVEQLNSLKRWKDNNPIISLSAPVGVGTDGEVFTLDLHEKRQGPHGLVAGMTGSGKSEFIITYILSMAVNYHPDEVAFVLIDYKGGGLAGAFDNPTTGVRLPHLVGTITNLDGASIQRSLLSIESELLRRQKKFNEVKSIVNEGTMDIYTYQKLYRAGKVSEPMPHLFIISDEFAELKQQQPEFMEKLISAARIGRSLGVHLILATQKPSGVVNEQIRSNTKFRVCLRVQDRSDSMDMLKRADAAELTDTGRFYLQVGYNEYFAMGQSAWCGADYEPQDVVATKQDNSVEFVDTTGQVIAVAKPKVEKSSSGLKQIVAVVNYLSDLAKEHGVSTKRLWCDELPKKIDLNSINNDTSLDKFKISLGIVDDPEQLKQFPLIVDFKKCHNLLIVGGVGSGKTNLIENILFLLSRKLTSNDLNYYILDYSSRILKVFRKCPQCGAVLQEEDENCLDNFFDLVNTIIRERKELFSSLEVDSYEAAKRIVDIPIVLIFIDNIAGLSTSRTGESYYYKLPTMLKDCANYGVKFVITCNHINDVSSRIRQEINDRLALHLKDKYSYSDILSCKVDYMPSEITGRGLCKIYNKPLEFQSAMLWPDVSGASHNEILKEEISRVICASEKFGCARQLSVYSEKITYDDFLLQFKNERIALGYSRLTEKPIALPLKQYTLLSIVFGKKFGKEIIVNNLLKAAQKENMDICVLKSRSNSVFDEVIDINSFSEAESLTFSNENVETLIKALYNTMVPRRKDLDEFFSKNEIDENADEFNLSGYKYLRERTKPIFLLLENVVDLHVFPNFYDMLKDLFAVASRRNVYIVGCFDWDSATLNFRDSVINLFSKKDIILFGGNYNKQSLCEIPSTFKNVKNVPYNVGVMKYRGNFHPIFMPCGGVAENIVDTDLFDIFNGENL